jgi:PTH1 family peptidyl-tRNA hydrolase
MRFWRRRTLPDFIVFGLGNPGPGYADTRHNLGFMAVDALRDLLGNPRILYRWSSETFEAEVQPSLVAGLANINTEPAGQGALRLLAAKPQIFMNRSGRAVAQTVNANRKVPFAVISDDVNLPWGKLRLRRNGGAGGHKGLISIIGELGGFEDFPRIRIGVGGGELSELTDYVLEPMGAEDLAQARKFARAAAVKALELAVCGYDRASSSDFIL